jgi:hypothetical protein
MRDGVLEHHWESADGRTKPVQIVLPRNKLNEVFAELLAGPSGGHLEVNKTLDKVRQRFHWLHSKSDFERWCQQHNTFTEIRGPQTRKWGRMEQYNVGAPFERIAGDVVRPFLRREGKSIPPDYDETVHQVAGGLRHP